MEKVEERKVVINGRTFEDVENDINECASWVYNQDQTRKQRQKEWSDMLKKYEQKADELNKAQENTQGPKVKYVAR